MFFDPLVNWIVPAFGFLFDKINVATTKPLSAPPKSTYPEPHRDPVDGKIVIENCKLYEEDLFNYGAVQVGKWIKQGKYNLTPEELKKEQERIKKKYDDLCK